MTIDEAIKYMEAIESDKQMFPPMKEAARLAIGALRYKKFLGKGFKTIRGTAATGLLPESTIRRMVADGTCPGVTVGNRFMVNVELLEELLEEKSINNERIW